MKIIRLGMLLTAVCAACGLAPAQTRQCYVVKYERDPLTKAQASARIAIESFEWRGDKPLAGVIQDRTTGVFIAVKVGRVAGLNRKRPNDKIRLAISFVGKQDDVFDDDGAAEAEAAYGEQWKWLTVSKNIKVAGRLHTYYLGCHRGSSKLIRVFP